MREKIKIEKFCCCTELRIGCYIIGGIGWVRVFVLENSFEECINRLLTLYNKLQFFYAQ